MVLFTLFLIIYIIHGQCRRNRLNNIKEKKIKAHNLGITEVFFPNIFGYRHTRMYTHTYKHTYISDILMMLLILFCIVLLQMLRYVHISFSSLVAVMGLLKAGASSLRARRTPQTEFIGNSEK